MKTFAFIFARGGSKGLPGKNILDLNGKSLLGHAIDLALSIDEVSEVYVSTDDKEIAKVAQLHDAKVIIRPDTLASDNSPELESWKHAINYLRDKKKYFDKFISLPTTSPLRSKEDVISCLEMLDDSSDLIVAVTESQRSPFFNIVKIDEKGLLKVFSEDNSYARRQDVPKSYDLTTVSYVSTPDFILSATKILEGRVKAVIVPQERALDIDTEMDLMLAKLLIKKNK
jgi:N-acylneuraminate cytidylyltransferase